MGTRSHHRPDGEGSEEQGGSGQPPRAIPVRRKQHPRTGGNDGDQTERGAGGVGELGRLAHFEAVDPRNPDHSRHKPTTDCECVDRDDSACGDMHGANQRPEPGAHLEGGDHDEDLRQLTMLGMDACGGGMDRTGCE